MKKLNLKMKQDYMAEMNKNRKKEGVDFIQKSLENELLHKANKNGGLVKQGKPKLAKKGWR
jgi:hypothetical protein